ncbi:MAG: intradiol ring-cleavage dioxygenase [Flavobacteriales bacterium]|nr:intradiol ring-cleavage dioxygenase [Flavobacteriales bacterium]
MIVQKKILILYITSLCLTLNSYSLSVKKSDNTLISESIIESINQEDCNWCGTSEAPENVSWNTVIPPEGELGEKLIISGTIFLPDGKTPAKDIVVYVHHTNNEGIYPKRGDEKGNGQYHGYLRGWMKTNSNGKYELETIRPAPYHSHGGEPAHIHYNVQGPDYPEYWLTAIWFSDDPRVTDEYKKSVKRSGGFSNIISLTKDENNILRGTRNIILEKFE